MDEIRPVLRIFELEIRKNERNCIFGSLGLGELKERFQQKMDMSFVFFCGP